MEDDYSHIWDVNIRHVYGACIYLYLMTSEARNTNQLEASGTLPLHSRQVRQDSFHLLLWFHDGLTGFSQAVVDPNQSICFSSGVKSKPVPQHGLLVSCQVGKMTFSVPKLAVRKIISQTCLVRWAGLEDVARNSRRKIMYLKQHFYGSEARTAQSHLAEI